MTPTRLPRGRAASLFFTSIFAISISTAISSEARASPPSSGTPRAFGKTIGEWSAKWWQWIRTFPVAQNPGDPQNPLLEGDPLVPAPVDCSRGQTGNVWFLAGNKGGVSQRSCTIPRSKALLFPLVNVIFWNGFTGVSCSVDSDCGADHECAAGACREAFDVDFKRELLRGAADGQCGLFAELDGRPLLFDDIAIVRAQSPAFRTVVIANDALGDVAGNVDPAAISDGTWVMLPRLSSGAHTLHFGGAACDAGVPVFSVDVTYQLSISGHH